MRKHQLYVIIGIRIILLPHLGFPRDINTIIFSFAGIAIIVMALRDIRVIHKSQMTRKAPRDAFTESKPNRLTSRSKAKVPEVFLENNETGANTLDRADGQ